MGRLAWLIRHLCPSLSEPERCAVSRGGGGGRGVSPAFRRSCQPLPSLELPFASRHPRAAATRIHLSAETSAQVREKICRRGRKNKCLIKKRAAGAAGIGSGAPVGVKPSVPDGRAPRLCPGAAAHRERGADQPARVYLRVSRKQRELKAAETPRAC